MGVRILQANIIKLVMVVVAAGYALFSTVDSTVTAVSLDDEPVLAARNPGGSVLLDCLVYRVDGAELVRQIEQATSTTSNEHQAVAEMLAAGAKGVTRLARIHGPTEVGGAMTYSSAKQVPMITVSQGQFSTQQSFSGYQDASTALTFECRPTEGGYSTRFSIQIESFLDGEDQGSIPPPRDEVRLQGSVSAPSGATRMYQFDAGARGGSMLVVLVTATTI